MGPRTFAQTAGIPESEAKRLLNQYFATYPRIKVWHMQLQHQLRNSRELTTPIGRKRIFFNRWSERLFKEGLAYIPQSTISDIVNDALVCLHNRIRDYRLPYDILMQVHDSIVVQCPEDINTIKKCVSDIKHCLHRPLEINGRIMTIPIEIKVGKNWRDLSKYVD